MHTFTPQDLETSFLARMHMLGTWAALAKEEPDQSRLPWYGKLIDIQLDAVAHHIADGVLEGLHPDDIAQVGELCQGGALLAKALQSGHTYR
jgi:hypothetical protein